MNSSNHVVAVHFPDAFQSMLFEAPAGSVARLDQSPWGRDVTLVLHEPYHAASGRICRGITAETEGMHRPALVCQRRDGSWEPVRLLHQGGRPAFGNLPVEGGFH
ncbi:DVU3141 family protein [Thioalkalivibrio sulfidiphilus]|uniref:DVU3141 family protein n=1 Tax=Thioalkalivibrio sulfidiphilus TaxID=1033854 RepID=UPI001E2B641F|nr:DVU3141 family protein [Thioalkalivibrio sulfidiphilus]